MATFCHFCTSLTFTLVFHYLITHVLIFLQCTHEWMKAYILQDILHSAIDSCVFSYIPHKTFESYTSLWKLVWIAIHYKLLLITHSLQRRAHNNKLFKLSLIVVDDDWNLHCPTKAMILSMWWAFNQYGAEQKYMSWILIRAICLSVSFHLDCYNVIN